MNIFNMAESNRPKRSAFDLSYEKLLTCDMGELIPVMCDEVIPGDIFDIGVNAVVRVMPMVAPILHKVDVFFHYFFVPYRILWTNWEAFITGGEDGTDSTAVTTWGSTGAHTAAGTLWDYLGLPIGITPTGTDKPSDLPRRAYYTIYNDYYRPEHFVTKVGTTTDYLIKKRCWTKDYFTAALPWQQRGTAPALPISGSTSAVWSVTSGGGSSFSVQYDNADDKPLLGGLDTLNNNTVDLSSATTFDISDLRLAFQVQKWLERNARAGARYTEFLKSHFGVSPRDDRLDRPEYIGGAKSPLIVSEVLQTSQTDTTPQGTLAGHGVSITTGNIGKYHVQEFGIIMGIMSIMPKPVYQQGIDRQWLRKTRYDFPFPEFAHLSEQAILVEEVFATSTEADNIDIFGYTGRYDECRVKKNMVVAGMRDDFDYWHISRQFSSEPSLNQDFLECTPRKDFLAVPEEDTFMVRVGNLIKAIRPLPVIAEPGFIDHN